MSEKNNAAGIVEALGALTAHHPPPPTTPFKKAMTSASATHGGPASILTGGDGSIELQE